MGSLRGCLKLILLIASVALTGCKVGGGGNNSANQAKQPTPNTQTPAQSNVEVNSTNSFTSMLVSNFSPFTAKTVLRSDISSSAQNLRAQPGTGMHVEPIELARFQVNFEPRIASLMSSIEDNRGLALTPKFSNCEFDIGMNKLTTSSNARVQFALERAANLCSKIERPEIFFYTGTLFEENPFSLTNIEDVLETVVTPLLLRGYAFSFFDPATNQQIRAAFLRIKFVKMSQDFNDFFSRIDAAISASETSSIDRAALSEMRAQAQSKWSKIHQWNEIGKNQLAQDSARILASGKTRSALPYLNLPDAERKALSMYLYAMMWRFRGGGFVKLSGTIAARFYFAQIPYTIIASLNGSDLASAGTLGAYMFSNLSLLGWGQWMDIGNTPGQESEAYDLVQMSARGTFQTADAENYLRARGYDSEIMKAYSLHFGICYLYSWERLQGIELEKNLVSPFGGFFDGPTAWGELCAGAALGLGLAETLLAGKR